MRKAKIVIEEKKWRYNEERIVKWLQNFVQLLRERLNNYQQVNQKAIKLYENYQYAEAIQYAKSALDIATSIWLHYHPNVGHSFYNLSVFLQAQGKYAEAEPYCYTALAIRKRLFDGDHPYIALTTRNLGDLLHAQGKYTQEAEAYFHEALVMFEKLFLQDHPCISTTFNNLGLLLQAQRRYEESEIQLNAALVMFQKFSLQYHPDFALSITNLGLLLQEQGKYIEALEKLHEAVVVQNKITSRIFAFSSEADRLEKYLASKVSEIQLQDRIINRETVAEQLPSGSVLLEFIRFFLYDFENQQWGSPYYVVFVLPTGQPDKVEMKVLGKAREIEELIEYSRLFAIAYVRDVDGQLQLARFDGKKLGVDFSKFTQPISQVKPETIPHYPYVLNAALRQKILDPIWKYIKDSRQIFISPDANLSLVPFGILPLDERGQELLGDCYQISYLASARDLFRSTVTTNRPASEPKVIADPKFLLDPPSVSHKVDPPSVPLRKGETMVLDEESLSRAKTTAFEL